MSEDAHNIRSYTAYHEQSYCNLTNMEGEGGGDKVPRYLCQSKARLHYVMMTSTVLCGSWLLSAVKIEIKSKES